MVRRRLVLRSRVSAIAAALLVWLLAYAPGADMLPEAKARMDRFEAGMKNVEAALLQGKGDEALQLEQDARRELAEAISVYDKTGIVNSGDAGMLKDYALLRTRAGDYDLAAETLERVLSREGGDAAVWQQYGSCLALTGPGRRQDAFDALRKALSLGPAADLEGVIQRDLGMLYRDEGLYQFARECYERAATLLPGDVRTQLALAALDAREGAMASSWKRISGIDPQQLPLHDVELRTLLRVALDEFDRAHRALPDTAGEQAAYARLLYQSSRVPESIMAANRAVRLMPGDADTWKFLGDVQYQLGNASQARKAYEKALEIQPDQPALRQRLERLPQATPSNQP